MKLIILLLCFTVQVFSDVSVEKKPPKYYKVSTKRDSMEDAVKYFYRTDKNPSNVNVLYSPLLSETEDTLSQNKVSAKFTWWVLIMEKGKKCYQTANKKDSSPENKQWFICDTIIPAPDISVSRFEFPQVLVIEYNGTDNFTRDTYFAEESEKAIGGEYRNSAEYFHFPVYNQNRGNVLFLGPNKRWRVGKTRDLRKSEMYKIEETLLPTEGTWKIFNEHGEREIDSGVFLLDITDRSSNDDDKANGGKNGKSCDCKNELIIAITIGLCISFMANLILVVVTCILCKKRRNDSSDSGEKTLSLASPSPPLGDAACTVRPDGKPKRATDLLYVNHTDTGEEYYSTVDPECHYFQ